MELVCPKCGSAKILQLDYGAKVDAGIDISQKCAYKCKACKQEFGTVSGKSLYTTIVQSISVEINRPYLFSDSFDLKVSSHEKGAKYRLAKKDGSAEYKGFITKDEWDSICDSLFNKLFLSGWHGVFYNSEIIDGTIWNIDIKLKKKHSLSYHGCNGYPPYWNQMIDLIAPILAGNGISQDKYKI